MINDSDIKNKLFEYYGPVYYFQPTHKEHADEEWIKLVSELSEFIYDNYQEPETVFAACKFHFEPVMMDAYLSIAKGLEDNLYLLQSEKVKAFLIEQLKDKKWLSGHANFLRPLIMMNDRNLINDIAKNMPHLWEANFANTFLMEAVAKMKIPGFRKEMEQFLNSGAKILVRKAETYLKNEGKYKPV